MREAPERALPLEQVRRGVRALHRERVVRRRARRGRRRRQRGQRRRVGLRHAARCYRYKNETLIKSLYRR